jgi:predicted DNA-binding antitoxin AbrB/MazE fold protein
MAEGNRVESHEITSVRWEGNRMTVTVEAIYEKGVLKLAQPLPLQENERVRVTVQSETSVAQQTYGLMGWTGDPETLERFALDPELDPQESA